MRAGSLQQGAGFGEWLLDGGRNLLPGIGKPTDAQALVIAFLVSDGGKRRFGLRQRTGVCGIVAGDGGQNQLAIGGAARERAEFIERIGKRHGAAASDASIGGPQAADASESGGTNNRAPSFRANSEGSQPGGNDGC